MVEFPTYRHSPIFFQLILSLLVLALVAKPICPFSGIDPDSAINGSFNLFGDAHFVDGGSSVQITRPVPSSSGLVIHRNPFKFSDPSSVFHNPTSFSTDFTFSISPHNGDGIAFLIIPSDFPTKFPGESSFGLSREDRFLGIEFDTSMDGNVGDENSNHVGVDVGSLISVKIINLSSTKLVLNSGVKLHSWVDYDASSKRLEVRLTKFGEKRPYNSLLTYQIDLSEMWKADEVLLGISSSSGNSQQITSVHSWRFRTRRVPKLLHSQPVNPRVYSRIHSENMTAHKKRACISRFLSGLIVGTGCGALVAFLVQLLWVIFVSRNNGFSAEKSMIPLDFRYEKVNVILDHGSGDVKK